MEDEEKVCNSAIEKQKSIKINSWYPQYYKHRSVILAYWDTEAGEFQIQVLSVLPHEFKTSLDKLVKPCLKIEREEGA